VGESRVEGTKLFIDRELEVEGKAEVGLRLQLAALVRDAAGLHSLRYGMPAIN